MGNNDRQTQIYPGNALMTVAEAADCLRFHPSTVYRLVRSGNLPALKLGKQWRVSRDAIHRWVENSHSAPDQKTTTPPRGA